MVQAHSLSIASVKIPGVVVAVDPTPTCTEFIR